MGIDVEQTHAAAGSDFALDRLGESPAGSPVARQPG